MAIEGAPKVNGVVFTKELQRTVGEKNPTKQSVFVGYKLDDNGHKVKVRYTGDGQELVEKTTIGKNTYVTKKEADALVMQMLGTSSVPKGVTVKYETDQNGTTSPILLFRGEKLDAKGMKELAQITNQKDEIQKSLNDMAKNVKFTDDMPNVKGLDLAKVDFKKLEIATPKPQGANEESKEVDKTKKFKRTPGNIKGKAKASPNSEEVIKKVKEEKSGTLDDTVGIKKPEDKPISAWAPTPEEAARIKKEQADKAAKAAKWKKAVDGGKQFQENLKGSEVSNPFYKVTLNSDTIRGFVKGAGGPSLVNKVWTSNMSFVQKKAVLIEILKNVKGHGMQNATVKTNGQKDVKIDDLIKNLQNSQKIISPEDRRIAFVFIQKLMAK